MIYVMVLAKEEGLNLGPVSVLHFFGENEAMHCPVSFFRLPDSHS
jgi:hypothetical protein